MRSNAPPCQSRAMLSLIGGMISPSEYTSVAAGSGARIAPGDVEMVGHRGREAQEFTRVEDWVEEEHVLQVLAAGIGVVHHEEVALHEGLLRVEARGRLDDVADGAELHGDQLGLGDGVAVRVEEGGRAVLRLGEHRGIAERTSLAPISRAPRRWTWLTTA